MNEKGNKGRSKVSNECVKSIRTAFWNGSVIIFLFAKDGWGWLISSGLVSSHFASYRL